MERLRPTLRAATYLDDAVWQAERERIFARRWVAAGRVDDVAEPGAVLRVDVAGESVLVTRDHGAHLHAFFNVCRHRGAELVPPARPERTHCPGLLRCPYHSWSYDLAGTLRRAPFLDPGDVGGVALHGAEVDTWGGFLFVRLEPGGPSLAQQLGAIPDRVVHYPLSDLVRGAAFCYDVAANWKVLAENYNECYHCGPVHPELCDLVPAFRHGGIDLSWDDGIPHRDGAWTLTTTGTSSRPAFPGLDARERRRHKGELIYPNLWLSLAAEHVATFVLRPVGPDRTEVRCDLLFHPDAVAGPGFDPSDAADLWDLVNRQDWAICESVQRGMSSRAWTGGWFAPMEDASADISTWYAAVMGDTEHG